MIYKNLADPSAIGVEVVKGYATPVEVDAVLLLVLLSK